MNIDRIYEHATNAGAYCETYLHGGDPKPPVLDNMDLFKFANLIINDLKKFDWQAAVNNINKPQEVSTMSLDVNLTIMQPVSVYSSNITHNLATMANAVILT